MAAACLTFGTFSASAQSIMGVSAGADLALPMGDFSETNGMGFGGSAMFHYNLIEDKLDLTGSVGYLTFSGKTISAGIPGFTALDVKSPAASIIPIRVGANYKFIEDLGLYVGADLGLSLLTFAATSVTVDVPIFGPITTEIPSTSSTLFSLAPRVGYTLPIGNNELDLSVRYDVLLGLKSEDTTTDPNTGQEVTTTSTSNLGFVGFRAAYRFNFGN